VVGAQGHHIVATADFLVQMGEQVAEVLVQADQDFLDFAAARAEGVADVIDRRITDTKEIRGATRTETKRIDRGF